MFRQNHSFYHVTCHNLLIDICIRAYTTYTSYSSMACFDTYAHVGYTVPFHVYTISLCYRRLYKYYLHVPIYHSMNNLWLWFTIYLLLFVFIVSRTLVNNNINRYTQGCRTTGFQLDNPLWCLSSQENLDKPDKRLKEIWQTYGLTKEIVLPQTL